MIYVGSDLHGCNPADFQELLKQAGFGDTDFLFILGDVIDRGDWGAELLLWLTQQPNIQLLLGNHEALMLTCSFLFEEVSEESLSTLTVKEIGLVQNWIDNGGGPTLKGLQRLLKSDPESVYGILDYLRDAPLYEDLELHGQRFILVHAGLGNYDTERPLSEYTPEELLLDRPSLSTNYGICTRVVFGHTPSNQFGEEYSGRAAHTSSWSCIDVGVALGYAPMLLRLDDMKEFYLKESLTYVRQNQSN